MENKTILITGGTSGIGYELTKLLYKSNHLIIVSRNQDKLDKLAHDFGVTIYKMNLSVLESVTSVANKIISEFKCIDILINNAGIQYTETFLDKKFDESSIEKEVNTNFTSLCTLTYKLLPLLDHEKESVILNVNSGLALSPKATSAIYCATKGALNIFTQSLRYQLEKTNVSVLQVFLPLVDTNMTKGRGDNKITPQNAAKQIIYGIEHTILNHDVGKVKFLRILLRWFPSIAQNIMKKY